MQGTIKKVMSSKGYGFIETDYQEGDLFFHKSNLDNIDIYKLQIGATVEFEVAEGRKGPEAVKITLADEAAEVETPEETELDSESEE